MESSRSISPCSSFPTISSSSRKAASKLICSTGFFADAFVSSMSGLHQCANMRGCRTLQRGKVIAALKRGDNAALGGLFRDCAYFMRGPREIVLDEIEVGQRIVA